MKGNDFMKLAYPAFFYTEDNGSCSVVIPDLGGCATQGRTLAEAMEMAVDAASGWLLCSVEEGEDIPQPSDIMSMQPEYPNGFSSIILVDLDEYSKTHSEKAVKKTLTIPSWVNEAAERKGINFSAVLKDAIIHQLQA